MVDQADMFMGQYLNHDKSETDTFIANMEDINLKKLSKTELVDYSISILEHLRNVSCVNFVKSARLGFYYSQRLQSMLKDKFSMNQDRAESTFTQLNQGLEGTIPFLGILPYLDHVQFVQDSF